MLTSLQNHLLEFCKEKEFHVTLADFIKQSTYPTQAVIEAFKDLTARKIIQVPDDSATRCIGVTNYGCELMGW